LNKVTVYPQAAGTLFDLDLRSTTDIKVGHGTADITVIEKLSI